LSAPAGVHKGRPYKKPEFSFPCGNGYRVAAGVSTSVFGSHDPAGAEARRYM